MPPLTQPDIIGLAASYVYAFALLLILEGVGRALKWPSFTTRKLIHIGAGLWIWGILWLFEHWQWGVVPFATFIGLNYIFYRVRLFQQMDGDSDTLGTVYFAVSITILFVLLWRDAGPDRVAIAAAAVSIMTWGDAMAALIGRRWGKNTYEFFGHTRTREGSIAFVAFALVPTLLTLLMVPGSVLAPAHVPIGVGEAIAMAVLGVAAGAGAEAVSPAGLDNLSVPLLAGLVMWLVSVVV